MISDCFIIIVITFLHIVFCLVIIHIVILTILTIIILTIKDVEARFLYQLPSARPPSATCSELPLQCTDRLNFELQYTLQHCNALIVL